MHIELVRDTCLFQQKLQFKNIERFSSFIFDIIRSNYVSKGQNIAS